LLACISLSRAQLQPSDSALQRFQLQVLVLPTDEQLEIAEQTLAVVQGMAQQRAPASAA
jgi:acetate kinase